MVVSMGYNHFVQDMNTPQRPGEYGRKIVVFQEKVSCRILVPVGCKEMKNINNNNTKLIDLAPYVWLHSSVVEYCTSIAEVMGSNPVEPLIFSGFFFPIA